VDKQKKIPTIGTTEVLKYLKISIFNANRSKVKIYATIPIIRRI
jgi:hypothetical protein